MRKYICKIIFIPVIILFISSFKGNDDAIPLINSIYQRYQKMSEPGFKGKYYMKYKTTTVYADSLKIPVYSEVVEAIYETSQYVAISSSASIIFNEKMGVVVSEADKQIFLYNPQTSAQIKSRTQNSILYEQKLFAGASVVSDKTEISNGKSYRKIRIKVADDIRKKTGISILDYLIDKNTNLAGMKTFFTNSPYGIKSIDLTILDQTNSPSNEIVSRNYYSTIFNENGKPQPRYKGYKITDYRKK